MAKQSTVKGTTPFAVNDVFGDNEDTIGAFTVLANDTAPGRQTKSLYSINQSGTTVATIASSMLGAAISMNANGTITYDPTTAVAIQALAGGEKAVDTFTYTVKLSGGTLSTATVSVNLTGVNDAPTNPRGADR